MFQRLRILSSIAVVAQVMAVHAQVDSVVVDTTSTDSASQRLNMDAVYARPLNTLGTSAVALGGYAEAHAMFAGTDGVNEGWSFVIPRLTLFVSADINDRIRFLTEIELEEGGREINIEYAALDLVLHPLFTVRGGVVLNPIGAFNQNHDGPRWDFIERPLASTTIIPATWSNVGFGAYGKTSNGIWTWGYEAYLTNGFDQRIIDNDQGRTWLPATKENSERFTESFNGSAMTTLKTALRHHRFGEVGLSWMGGVYNKFQDDGLELDRRRRVDVYAIDYNNEIGRWGTAITGEWVVAHIDVPEVHSPQYGRLQSGGFIDVVQRLLQRRMLGWDNARLEVAGRFETADYNNGVFETTSTNIGDCVKAFTVGLAFRPVSGTVIRANFSESWTRDVFENPASRSAAIMLGLSTYF